MPHSLLTEYDLYLFREGTHYRSFDRLGAHLVEAEGRRGVYFAVWAPNARFVSVIGDFNFWNNHAHPLQPRDDSGIWEAICWEADHGQRYKYYIESQQQGYRAERADPYAFFSELRPKTASIIWDISNYTWGDSNWMANRTPRNSLQAPLSIYEIHLGSWKRKREEGGRWLNYRELAHELPEYIKHLGFTHVELLPVLEHPYDPSWGYQATGYFAPTSRFGAPQDFMYLVDALHQAGIGVILDWVPAHFPTDEHGLAYFDGTHLYEHQDPKKGAHPDWKTLIYNYGRREVANFLISSALFWLEKYHLDGLRVDAVASMLYLDYSRQAGQWIPNEYGGRENIEAIHFIRRLNEQVYATHRGAFTLAEESTSWPMVSRPTHSGGLGFGYKWNMGWMNDVLSYISKDPIYRSFHHNQLTFGLLYAFQENFVLPLSHDEVVHGKGSLLQKMPGDDWQKFANLRLLYGFMYGSPGKKLLFMGAEIGEWREWDAERDLDWDLLQYPLHQGLQQLIRDMNHLLRQERALYELDFEGAGFSWVDCGDREQSVVSFLRFSKSPREIVLVVCNFTPITRHHYRIGVPVSGLWNELLNSDATCYGGSGQGNYGQVYADDVPYHSQPHSLNLTIPGCTTLFFKPTDWKPQQDQKVKESAESKELRRLARYAGISLSYIDSFGQRRKTSPETIITFLQAMGIQAHSPSEVTRSLHAFRTKVRSRILPLVKVTRINESKTQPLSLVLTLPYRVRKELCELSFQFEDGQTKHLTVRLSDLQCLRRFQFGKKTYGKFRLAISFSLPLGYHQVRFSVGTQPEGWQEDLRASMTWIVAPSKCYLPIAPAQKASAKQPLAERKKEWGISLQLYSLVTERSPGIGSYSDLIPLVNLTREAGGSFIGLNPVHATSLSHPEQISPYAPTSRLFLNVLYLDLENIEDVRTSRPAQTLLLSDTYQQANAALRSSELVDYRQVIELKLPVLRYAYEEFCKSTNLSPRYQDYQKFVATRGQDLENYALHEALQKYWLDQDTHCWGFPVWPEQYRSPQTQAVRDFAKQNVQELGFYQYLQWQAHLQLTQVVTSPECQALSLGLYLDMALSSDAAGADVWANSSLFAKGVQVGAPPDALSAVGQDWGFSPFLPDTLQQSGYQFFAKALRATMQYAGAVRLDHVMSLMRLFWIPKGLDARDGAYVRYPFRDLLGVISLESNRQQCVVIGEDLGTVPDMFRDILADWNVLSYKVLRFMKDGEGEFAPARSYGQNSLVVAGTHDMATLWGFWEGQDLLLRKMLNLFYDPAELDQQSSEREHDKRQLLALLKRERLVQAGEKLPSLTKEIFLGIHQFLARTSSWLMAVSLEDIFSETFQVNLPGVTTEYPCWRNRYHISLEALKGDPLFHALVDVLKKEGRHH